MTYARKMAEECAWRCVGHDPGEIERMILAVIERCAKEAITCAFPRCGDSECIAEQAAADRIRALATEPQP